MQLYHDNKAREGHESDDDTQQMIANVQPANKMLTCVAASYHLAELNLVLGDKTTTQAGFEYYRSSEHNARWVFMECTSYKKPLPTTLREMMKFLCYGSPKAREILKDIKNHILGTKEKLMIVEEIPDIACHWELILHTLHIKSEAVHAKLSHKECIEIFRDFNNPGSGLKVIILTYNFSTQGMNLQGACHRVITATFADNLSSERQAIYRPSRVSTILVELYLC